MCGRSDYLKRKIVRAALVIKKTSWLQGGLHNELFYRGKVTTTLCSVPFYRLYIVNFLRVVLPSTHCTVLPICISGFILKLML